MTVTGGMGGSTKPGPPPPLPLPPQELAPALRAGLGDGPVPQGKGAGRVGAAAVEGPPPLGPLLGEWRPALGTVHADGKRLDGLALRVGGAGEEPAVPAGPDHHGRPALLAGLLRRLRGGRGGPLPPVHSDHRPALRIAGAGEEVAVPPLLQDHGPAALLAGLRRPLGESHLPGRAGPALPRPPAGRPALG